MFRRSGLGFAYRVTTRFAHDRSGRSWGNSRMYPSQHAYQLSNSNAGVERIEAHPIQRRFTMYARRFGTILCLLISILASGVGDAYAQGGYVVYLMKNGNLYATAFKDLDSYLGGLVDIATGGWEGELAVDGTHVYLMKNGNIYGTKLANMVTYGDALRELETGGWVGHLAVDNSNVYIMKEGHLYMKPLKRPLDFSSTPTDAVETGGWIGAVDVERDEVYLQKNGKLYRKRLYKGEDLELVAGSGWTGNMCVAGPTVFLMRGGNLYGMNKNGGSLITIAEGGWEGEFAIVYYPYDTLQEHSYVKISNNAQMTVWMKTGEEPKDGRDNTFPAEPGVSYKDIDGLAIPSRYPNKIYKVVNGLNVTISSTGEIDTSNSDLDLFPGVWASIWQAILGGWRDCDEWLCLCASYDSKCGHSNWIPLGQKAGWVPDPDMECLRERQDRLTEKSLPGR